MSRVLSAWRLTKARYAGTALSGIGSSLMAGRWHLRGRPVVYSASSASLALLETLVHAERADLLRAEYVAIPLSIPYDAVEVLDRATLPADWQAWPQPASTRILGTRWFDSRRTLALIVPSVVVPHETNVLLNPQHPEFPRIEIGAPEPFPVDARFARGT